MPIRPASVFVATLAWGVAYAGSGADSSAQIKRGRELADQVCTACHKVAPDQSNTPLLDPPAPSFMEIAGRAGLDAKSLRHFVTSTHWKAGTEPLIMPNLSLTPEQATDVIHYLLSLRGR